MAIGQAAAGTPGGGSALGRALAPLLQPRTLTATIYLLVSMFVGLTWHVVLATGLLLAAPTFPWPSEPDELVDRLITDHLEGLLPRL